MRTPPSAPHPHPPRPAYRLSHWLRSVALQQALRLCMIRCYLLLLLICSVPTVPAFCAAALSAPAPAETCSSDSGDIFAASAVSQQAAAAAGGGLPSASEAPPLAKQPGPAKLAPETPEAIPESSALATGTAFTAGDLAVLGLASHKVALAEPEEARHTEHQEDRHNFADARDGAKLVAANKEAKKAAAVLDSDGDTYLKNVRVCAREP